MVTGWSAAVMGTGHRRSLLCGAAPIRPRGHAPPMTLRPSGGLIGDVVAHKAPARWPESSSLVGGPEMPEHKIGTREEWQAARNELAELEGETGERGERK